MSVAQHHGSVGVSEKLANGVEGNARLHEAAGKVMAQIMESKVLQLRSLSQASPRSIRSLQSIPSHTRKDAQLSLLCESSPRLECGMCFGIQRNTTGLPVLRRRTVNSDPSRVQIDVFPPQMKELTAAQPGVHRHHHNGVQVIGIGFTAKRQGPPVPSRTPFIETDARLAETLIAP